MSSLWIEGITDKYPKEILEGRMYAEGSVIGLIWKDPLILEETKLTAKDFFSFDGRLFFSIAKELRNKKVNDFNEVAVVSNLDKKFIDKLNERGGYTAITNLSDIVSEKNKDQILDALAKYNIYVKLYNEGFNITGKTVLVKVKGVDTFISPLEFFKTLTSTEILEWYTARITGMFNAGYDTKLLADEDLSIDDDFIDSLNKGEEYGTPYASAGTDINGDNINVFPFLSSRTLGLKHQASHYIAGFSSSGKTCLWCSIVMAMALQEKILIICNEQSSKVWKINMLVFILYKYFRYFNITKSNLMTGDFTTEQYDMLMKAKTYFNETYANRIHFIQLAETSIDVVKAKVRYYHLQYGYTMVIYDTLKIADANHRNDSLAGWEELVQYSRDLDTLAKRYDLIMCASVQLAQSNLGQLFLGSNCLSGAKGIVEQLDTLLEIRDVYKEELDPESKYYCHPYQLKEVTDEQTGKTKWVEEPFFADPKYSWKMIFLGKARNAENSTSSGSVIMMNFMGQFAVFKEQCWARPKHGIIGA